MIRRRAATSPFHAFAKRILSTVLGIAVLVGISTASATARAQAELSGPALAATGGATCAELTTRVAYLEAYVTNGAPKALVSPEPGHNAWMMTSSALVLFMTLPGLALFYGGLVRENVLSVMAQCLGCAGLVTILWWLVGYSLCVRLGVALRAVVSWWASARDSVSARSIRTASFSP